MGAGAGESLLAIGPHRSHSFFHKPRTSPCWENPGNGGLGCRGVRVTLHCCLARNPSQVGLPAGACLVWVRQGSSQMGLQVPSFLSQTAPHPHLRMNGL